MRSLALILTTFVTLCVAFFAYVRLTAPPVRISMPTDVPTTTPSMPDDATANSFGRGTGAWVNLYEKDSGNLYARLRAAQYVPLADGRTYHLSRPEADFYQHDGQVVHLLASDGDVEMVDQDPQRTISGSAPMNPPGHGTLNNVILTLFPSRAAQEKNEPDVTVRLDNARFDTDTCRMYTVSETNPATGRKLSADEIPVTLRGRDMDFDGTGLLLDWNDLAHDLKSLVVQHGQKLTIKNASSFDTKNAPAEPQQPVRELPPAPSLSSPSEKPRESASPAAAPSKPAATNSRVYVASFIGNVRVVQDGQDKVHADQMDVTMASRAQNADAEHSALAPTASVPMRAQPTVAANRELSPALPVIAPEPKETTKTNQPLQSNGPVDIYWTGPLQVVPQPNTGGLKPGQQIVRFTGAPMHIYEDNVEIAGTTARYVTANESARMTGQGDQPVKLTFFNAKHQQAGTVLSPRVDYLAARREAVFSGVGTADFSDPAHPDDALRAAWARQCVVFLTGAGKQSQIQRAVLQGNADVRDRDTDGHEKLQLTGQQIVADFDRPAGVKREKDMAPVVRRVETTGDAKCVIHDLKTHGPDQSIATDQLTIETAESATGELYPQLITADGNVHAIKDSDDLWSHRLVATVVPSVVSKTAAVDQSKFQLGTLLATGSVRARGKDGQTAAGDVLSVEDKNGDRVATLLGGGAEGLAATPAVVTGDNATLRGPRIDVNSRTQWAKVVGPGTIDGMAAPAPGRPARPLHVQWQESAEMDGVANVVNVLGQVQATTKEAGGTTDTTRSDRAILFLTPAPPKQARVVHRATQKRSTSQPNEFNMMGGRQVKLVSLLDHAEMASETRSPLGKLMRRSTIAGDRIDAYLPEKKLIVPGRGRMLVEDYSRPPKAQANGAQDGGRGETSFQWEKQFSFDQAAKRAIFDGPVTIVHWPDLTGKKGTTMLADRVEADLEPAGAQASDEQLTIKQVIATGHVRITTADANIDATDMTYDPVAEELVANGTPDDPVHVSDDRGRGDASFQEVWIDTRTNQIKRVVGFTGQMKQ